MVDKTAGALPGIKAVTWNYNESSYSSLTGTQEKSNVNFPQKRC